MHSSLNPRYLLDNLIEGPCNSAAIAMARSIFREPQSVDTPVLLVAAGGLGSTHLLQGIAHAARRRQQCDGIVYLSMEKLLTAITQEIRMGQPACGRAIFANSSVVLLDDARYIEDRPSTQAIVLDLLAFWCRGGRQIVVATDPSSRRLNKEFLNRIPRARAHSMMPPDTHTRRAIARQWARRVGFDLSVALELNLVATHRDIRELEGAINSRAAAVRLQRVI